MTQSGMVIRTEGARVWVAVAGAEVPCVLRGRLRRDQLRNVSNVLVVGDRVQVDLLADGSGAIAAREPRRTEIARPTSFRDETHVIAANVDQLIIVQAALQPRFKLALVERFLVMSRRSGVDPLVVVNKCDLVDEATIHAWTAPLLNSDVPVLLTSATAGTGLSELRDRLTGRISVLAGQSGVGKSSLVNTLYPQAQLRTAAVNEQAGKGRHTTTSSRLFALPDSGYLVDTPGIRELALYDDDGDAIAEVFPEIDALADGCKFGDCTHSHEPNCAVKAAVEQGGVSEERYQHYLRLTISR
ncbi:MAG: ribosome small subunit-dependent GTPase A [Symbiobacteriia bacterium]